MSSDKNFFHCDGVEILQLELTRRISQNHKYSMRAFARSLQVSPATLSLILARKLPLSKKNIEKMVKALSLHPAQIDSLRELTRKKKMKSRGDLEPNITMEIFTVLSEWYHFAILSLLELSHSTVEPKWISKKLGITTMESRMAVERLKKLKLISAENGLYKQTAAPLRIGNTLSNAAARKFQKQLIEKAIYSLENDPPQNRDISAITFAMNSTDLTYASDRITKFRRRLCEELENRGKPNGVYSLSIQLFPMTRD